jgi:hypothetical protein
MNGMKRTFGGLLFFFLLGNLLADEHPLPINEFISQNGKYILKLIDENNVQNNYSEEWELRYAETGEVKYTFKLNRYSLSVFWPAIFISDDGNNIILVNWFLGIYWNKETEDDILNKNVLMFYFMGNEIKKYKLSDVFDKINNGIESASHLQWTNYNSDKNCIIVENDELIITTLETCEYIFNIKNGEIILKIKLKK